MKALIIDGRVAQLFDETIQIEGEDGELVDVALADRFSPEFLEQLVEYDPANPPPEPADAAPGVKTVSMFQARVALQRAGLLDQVQTALDAMLDGQQKDEAKLAWEWAGSVERSSPFVALLAGALGLDADDLDALFADAASVI